MIRLNEPSILQQQLIPWRKKIDDGFYLRGLRSKPSGKPVIQFTHGNGLCALTYEPFLSGLCERYDLFLFDIQGHGDSDCGTIDNTFLGWEENARLLELVWQDYQADYGNVSSIGMGHSMGAVLTLLRASEYPSTFSQICLLDPVILSPTMIIGSRIDELFKKKRKMPLAEQARRRFNGWPDEHSAFQFFHRQAFFRHWSSASLNAYIKHGLKQVDSQLKLKCAPTLEANIFDSVPKSLWNAIRRLKTDTRIFYGTQTFPFIESSVTRACKKNHRIQAIKVKGDHCFVQTNPEDIALSVIQFLSGADYAIASSL